MPDDTLRQLIQTFVRRFGLLESRKTPCGRDMTVPEAHAFMVLLEADRKDKMISVSNLAEKLRIDVSNVSRLCKRLDDAGHIQRVKSPEDGRVRVLELTEKGYERAKTVRESSREYFEKIQQDLSDAESARVYEAFEILNRQLQTLIEDEGDQ